MQAPEITLISHALCPFVQRAVATLKEKNIPFTRRDVDLNNKPDWFLEISPLGKTPVLQVGPIVIFESAVILEYLEEVYTPHMHPADPLAKARHRSWMEFGTAILHDILAFYNATNPVDFDAATLALDQKFSRLEGELADGPYFAGRDFTLVDAVFGAVFRYFDVFDTIGDIGLWQDKPKVTAWRQALAERPSIRDAVAADYNEKLKAFIERKGTYLADRLAAAAEAA